MDESADEIPNYRLKNLLRGHDSVISTVKYNKKGDLASADYDGKILLWNYMDQGPPIKAILEGHSEGISDISWSHCDRYLISASDDCDLRFWDVERVDCERVFRGHNNYVYCCNFCPNSSVLMASGSYDGEVKIWDRREKNCTESIPVNNTVITSTEFNYDGQYLIYSSLDGFCRVRDMRMRKVEFQLGSEDVAISHAKYAPNCRYILVSTQNSKITLYSKKNNFTKPAKVYKGHFNTLYCLYTNYCTTRSKTYIVSGSEDHKIYIWNLNTQENVQIITGHRDIVITTACHPTKHELASASLGDDHVIRIWRSKT